MTTLHNLGFPRIGAQRELKFALESYWKGESSRDALEQLGAQLRKRHWDDQAGLDLVPVGDFAFYDQMLDMSFTLGNLPERARHFHGDALDNYFRVARGRSAHGAQEHASCCGGIAAGEMTKWFDTNYHYIVPELTAATEFKLDASRLLEQLAEARAHGTPAKPVIIGPVTYLALGKAKDDSDRLALLPKLLPVYGELLDTLAARGVEWVQIDEPLLVTELDDAWQHAFNLAYHHLKACRVKILLATYFGQLQENRYLAANLPVAGLHIDAINGREDVLPLVNMLSGHKVLSLGVINGRNIWKTDLTAVLDALDGIVHVEQVYAVSRAVAGEIGGLPGSVGDLDDARAYRHGLGRNHVIDHTHLLAGASYAQPLLVQPRKGLRTGVFVHDMQVGVEQNVLGVERRYRVRIDQFLIERARRHGEIRLGWTSGWKATRQGGCKKTVVRMNQRCRKGSTRSSSNSGASSGM